MLLDSTKSLKTKMKSLMSVKVWIFGINILHGNGLIIPGVTIGTNVFTFPRPFRDVNAHMGQFFKDRNCVPECPYIGVKNGDRVTTILSQGAN